MELLTPVELEAMEKHLTLKKCSCQVFHLDLSHLRTDQHNTEKILPLKEILLLYRGTGTSNYNGQIITWKMVSEDGFSLADLTKGMRQIYREAGDYLLNRGLCYFFCDVKELVQIPGTCILELYTKHNLKMGILF